MTMTSITATAKTRDHAPTEPGAARDARHRIHPVRRAAAPERARLAAVGGAASPLLAPCR
ncbi:thiol:disulfide interchange protein [Burkholderia pseudomallei]|uniref:thiol:disulfide interchange protein n=1 Tax=Burkholderia pseudomallei TaxID=28450 RepID=UPI000975DA16|nr:thiol:disulfide interchange protein [Burkholderia pseudomallei]OMV04396.1 thiol:disulfide interchange protein [Burkholderia pseudomallei]